MIIPVPIVLSKGLSIKVKMSTHKLNTKKMICSQGFNGLINAPGKFLFRNKLVDTVSEAINCSTNPAYNNTVSKDPESTSIILIKTCSHIAATGISC